MSADKQKRIAELRRELDTLELEELNAKKARLFERIKDLGREDMQLLREMLSLRIAELYDGDDE